MMEKKGEKSMDTFVMYLANNLVTWVAVIAGIVAPGILTVGIFNRDLFVQLDFLKLICLSIAICIPSAGILFLAILSIMGKGKNVYIIDGSYMTLTSVFNFFAFSIVLFIKIVDRDMLLIEFVLYIALIVFLLIFMLWICEKVERKK